MPELTKSEVTMLELRDDFKALWPQPFDAVVKQQGEVYREKEGRRTLRFEHGSAGYFLKVHMGVGWLEIIKNLVQLRLPVIGATNEWEAINKLHQLGVGTMSLVGFGKQGSNPAKQLSFVLTEELDDMVSVEDFCAPWKDMPPTYRVRKMLVEALAKDAATVHGSGMNHRDFYICHFLMKNSSPLLSGEQVLPKLYLIDLHRAQMRSKVPTRWLVKDLASLYFSAVDIGLTQRDVVRFLRHYLGPQVSRQLKASPDFWHKVIKRTDSLYQRDFNKRPYLPLR
jgi:heptose I phosphotransferase|tara:strand:+ start:1352 stop:2197 length:846 start_codon:yes stop_codon:yes gene_type:complete